MRVRYPKLLKDSENQQRNPKWSGFYFFLLSDTATDAFCPYHDEDGKHKNREDTIRNQEVRHQNFIRTVYVTDNT